MTHWPVRETDQGCLLSVKVTPKAAKDQIDGLGQDDAGRNHLKVKVRAVPENGSANRAVCLVLAKALDVPKSSVEISAGETSRIKQVLIRMPMEDLACALVRIVR